MTAPAVDVRRATDDDLAGTVALLDENFVDHLAVDRRADGFLSARFTLDDVRLMNRTTGVFVAVDAGRVVGALCTSHGTPDATSGVLAAMARSMETTCFSGRPLGSARVMVYGPVVVAWTHRGRHLLRPLYEACLAELRGRYDVGVAFVAAANPRSMRAHVVALGMAHVADFESDGRRYALLAFDIPDHGLS